MSSEVVDTNVLVVATAFEPGWTRPRVPTDDLTVIRRVFEWVAAFRKDSTRRLVRDDPERTIQIEYNRNLPEFQSFGRAVVQHKFDTNCLEIVGLTYWDNGGERVANLPDSSARYFHDLGDRKMVAAAAAANAPIVNATDGDWTEDAVVTGLDLLGVEVVQLLSADERRACKERL